MVGKSKAAEESTGPKPTSVSEAFEVSMTKLSGHLAPLLENNPGAKRILRSSFFAGAGAAVLLIAENADAIDRIVEEVFQKEWT